ncbi:cation diffusion facilitator family transporter [Treponema zioleckii]|uniref:cation diffusion facilitator family transporter n=1 Tax=Treponema zioleckii TaxID=331680 RepID=UPI00168B9D19|nr:cation diffusion facilitator family transporter [Treponema zioleckii]
MTQDENVKIPAEMRDKIIIQTSLVGIAMNVFLAGFKAAVGFFSNSIAVILDAVNNFSDALSSLVTIIGTKLSSKAPDKKHPLGYGRIEYLSAMIVSAIVLYAGITSAVESVKKIIHPETASYSVSSLIIIAAAVFVKIFLGLFVKSRGKKTSSGALVASGADALFDAILSASVLASALVYKFASISLESYVGVLISVFIIKSGFEMMIETLDDILGRRADKATVLKIKKLIASEEGVRGAFDLILNNYGPDKNYASVHIELPDSMTVSEVDVLTRKIEAKVYRETGVILTGVGVYSYNTKNDFCASIRNDVQKIVLSHDWALQMHGFFIDQEQKSMRFDVVFSFSIEAGEGLKILKAALKEKFPDYQFEIAADVDISD